MNKKDLNKGLDLSVEKKQKKSHQEKIGDIAGNAKKEMSENLHKDKEAGETPNTSSLQRKRYAQLLKKLTPEQQKEMKKNIRISADGTIEMIKMKKKFSMLTAKSNDKDIFDESHKDKNGNAPIDKGIKGVTYFTGRAAREVCKEQNKKFLKDSTEVDQFISHFPGENTKEKIFNFVQLFGLEKAGCWDPYNVVWKDVDIVGDVRLSEVDEDDDVYEVKWNDNKADIGRFDRRFPALFLAYEDC